MSHELVMLRGVEYCKKQILRLQEKCLQFALKSFSTEYAKEGTLGQVRILAEMAVEKEDWQRYLELLKIALGNMPTPYRALLVAIYVKKISKEALCAKYHVSLSMVYRKLARARKCFREKLLQLGCTETWFRETYGNNEWISSLIARAKNGARAEEC